MIRSDSVAQNNTALSEELASTNASSNIMDFPENDDIADDFERF
jgi:hypothetical protein